MNIAHLVSYNVQYPLTKHNGRYEWVLTLAKHQAQQGHTVTIYAGSGSHDSTSTVRFSDKTVDFGDRQLNNLALATSALTNSEHDIFHSHFDFLHYFAAHATTKPLVYTQHWFPNQRLVAASGYDRSQHCLAVPVTHLMHSFNQAHHIPTHDTIYHGIDLSLFSPPPQQNRSGRLVFVGRIAPHKGVLQAVQVAQKAGVGLDIIGKLEPKDQDYWATIEPLVDGKQIRFIGPLPHDQVADVFRSARAFLFPAQSQEAFGLVTIEAQACGSPVITSSLGAANELVLHGKTGFVADNIDGFVAAVQQLDSINPQQCRAFAEQFDQAAMFTSYDALYNQLVAPR